MVDSMVGLVRHSATCNKPTVAASCTAVKRTPPVSRLRQPCVNAFGLVSVELTIGNDFESRRRRHLKWTQSSSFLPGSNRLSGFCWRSHECEGDFSPPAQHAPLLFRFPRSPEFRQDKSTKATTGQASGPTSPLQRPRDTTQAHLVPLWIPGHRDERARWVGSCLFPGKQRVRTRRLPMKGR
ncbi:hypothetical protein WDL1P1_00795 (plasmid) [Variovorax sp. WDL1]|nr:hypothetical protein WDL1P1_00795 [Variovorax sp. WDL1]